MQTEENKVSRRKLVGWLGIVSVFAMAGSALRPWKKAKPQKTVRMLTEDGQLVEVDAKLLATNRRRISDKELQSWVKGK
jgi:hypothetical protein